MGNYFSLTRNSWIKFAAAIFSAYAMGKLSMWAYRYLFENSPKKAIEKGDSEEEQVVNQKEGEELKTIQEEEEELKSIQEEEEREDAVVP